MKVTIGSSSAFSRLSELREWEGVGEFNLVLFPFKTIILLFFGEIQILSCVLLHDGLLTSYP